MKLDVHSIATNAMRDCLTGTFRAVIQTAEKRVEEFSAEEREYSKHGDHADADYCSGQAAAWRDVAALFREFVVMIGGVQ